MRVEHENRSGNGRRTHGLSTTETERRSGEDRRVQQSDGLSDGHLDEFNGLLVEAAFSAKLEKGDD
jgi:hypothetical protein